MRDCGVQPPRSSPMPHAVSSIAFAASFLGLPPALLSRGDLPLLLLLSECTHHGGGPGP